MRLSQLDPFRCLRVNQAYSSRRAGWRRAVTRGEIWKAAKSAAMSIVRAPMDGTMLICAGSGATSVIERRGRPHLYPVDVLVPATSDVNKGSQVPCNKFGFDRRLLRRCATAALFGLATNILIGLGLGTILWVHFPHSVALEARDNRLVSVLRGVGIVRASVTTGPQWAGVLREVPGWSVVDGTSAAQLEHAVGFPFIVLSCYWNEDGQIRSGIVVNRSNLNDLGKRWWVFPLRPNIAGMLLGTSLYSALFVCVSVSVRRLLKLYRKRRGKCLRCGYPAVVPICPECGTSIPRRPAFEERAPSLPSE